MSSKHLNGKSPVLSAQTDLSRMDASANTQADTSLQAISCIHNVLATCFTALADAIEQNLSEERKNQIRQTITTMKVIYCIPAYLLLSKKPVNPVLCPGNCPSSSGKETSETPLRRCTPLSRNALTNLKMYSICTVWISTWTGTTSCPLFYQESNNPGMTTTFIVPLSSPGLLHVMHLFVSMASTIWNARYQRVRQEAKIADNMQAAIAYTATLLPEMAHQVPLLQVNMYREKRDTIDKAASLARSIYNTVFPATLHNDSAPRTRTLGQAQVSHTLTHSSSACSSGFSHETTPSRERSSSKKCSLHGKGNHDTEDCHILKIALATKGVLRVLCLALLRDLPPTLPSVLHTLLLATTLPRRQAPLKTTSPWSWTLNSAPHKKLWALVDTRATISSVNTKLCSKFGWSIIPHKGKIVLATSNAIAHRLGVTKLIKVLYNNKHITHSFEFLDLAENIDVSIGTDLMPSLGIHLLGLAESWYGSNTPQIPTPIAEIEKPNNSPAGTPTDHSQFMKALLVFSKANEAIPITSFCIVKESIVRLLTPPDQVVYRRQYPIALQLVPLMAKHINQWLTDGTIQRAPTVVFPAICERIKATQAADKGKHDKDHKIIMEFPNDSNVMVKNILRKSKTDPRYEGPFTVKGRTTGGSYILQDKTGALLSQNIPSSQAIIDHCQEKGDYLYKVCWKNYVPDQDTWEPISNFNDLSIIDKYWQRRGPEKPTNKATIIHNKHTHPTQKPTRFSKRIRK
ncbi:hypothetical protein PHYBLDRAFT_169703 [Phycomyces blakesleeanus NRRL 1555(-)]|uniref:Chromo domain-containing protein n=1 Tax=Phycomyces blakesleeanus (strain ATCC 8743b / DSM 1359 / FGSC 10004 / NBRC 33097 / NRRL 1555) TaxID=763407 RepID=A0A162X598_PHYB8|nr:hypothetical protein PHYBLDRAFT_169703 [Phycomyces blakesleeanus NRRL 1555(-)]OAD72575.1 hypothetical protein PHYBLDRAFT_169703 [Phycomyces blakesleeanus NRRL 1555(-)]|eukprot:XP_018290615.1 hypothetical protein PHYBLDRAFT_169703 [Phycomyces blakesleeanus NRRL 1555(-)]